MKSSLALTLSINEQSVGLYTYDGLLIAYFRVSLVTIKGHQINVKGLAKNQFVNDSHEYKFFITISLKGTFRGKCYTYNKL